MHMAYDLYGLEAATALAQKMGLAGSTIDRNLGPWSRADDLVRSDVRLEQFEKLTA